jgi:hypothetical protein
MRAVKAEGSHNMRFSESDDFLSFRLHGSDLLVAGSYQPGIAAVRYDVFARRVQDFVEEKLRWIAENYPSAFNNPAMGEALKRAGIAFRW